MWRANFGAGVPGAALFEHCPQGDGGIQSMFSEQASADDSDDDVDFDDDGALLQVIYAQILIAVQ